MTHYGKSVATVIGSSCFWALLVGFASQAADGQAPPAPAAPQRVADESPNDLFVTVGKSIIVNSAVPIERISVGFGDFAEASAVSPTEVLVNGRAPGQTSLIIWQSGGGKLFFDITVEPSQFGNSSKTALLRRELSKELPGQNIDVDIQGDLIFLRGSVRDLTSADRAVAIASALGRPVNLFYVDVPPPDSQILLKVKFASVDRSLSNQLGINLFSTGAANTIGSVTTGQFSPPTVGGGSGSSSGSSGGLTGRTGVVATLASALNLFFFRPDLDLGATIQALEVKNIVQVLAEPNVLAENGKQASFLAGGEFPYPVVQGGTTGGSTAVTIQFRRFGVLLNFIPTITPRGTIRLQVAPEVSALDYANGVTLQGFSVPGISVRNVNTEVELAEGQSFAIGGLLDNRENEIFNKIPFIGDIPILGKFFQSRTKTRNNTELMVIVTPEIVRPIPAGQPVPLPNFPVPFLPPNTPGVTMATPGQSTTGPVPVKPPKDTIPVETLIKSYVQRPLAVSSTVSGSGTPNNGQSSAGLQSSPVALPVASAPVTPQPQ